MSHLDQFESDTRDSCDAFAILDDVLVRELDECEVCGSHECRHYCGFCRVSKPCPCMADDAFDEGLLYRGRHGGRER